MPQERGAPVDFGGAVYRSSTPPVVSDDTDSGIPVTPMPTGVSLQHQLATKSPVLNTSNPAPAQFLAEKAAKVGKVQSMKQKLKRVQ
jgi:hypothetical protein